MKALNDIKNCITPHFLICLVYAYLYEYEFIIFLREEGSPSRIINPAGVEKDFKNMTKRIVIKLSGSRNSNCALLKENTSNRKITEPFDKHTELEVINHKKRKGYD